MQQKGLGDQKKGRMNAKKNLNKSSTKRHQDAPTSRSLVRTMINGKQVLLDPSVVLKKYPTIKPSMPDPMNSTASQPKQALPRQGTTNRKKKGSLTTPTSPKIINQQNNHLEDTDDFDIYMDSLLDEEIERNLEL